MLVKDKLKKTYTCKDSQVIYALITYFSTNYFEFFVRCFITKLLAVVNAGFEAEILE